MMLASFFQLNPPPANEMFGVYDPRLVILSYLVATSASYIALDFTGRLRDPNNTHTSSLMWLLGGSIAMGAGIWSMHFIGMLSFNMKHMQMSYDSFWTILSLFVAILASSFALFLLKTKVINIKHMAIGGIILGFAISSMHYTGMEAMKIVMNIHYLPSLFMLSILIAILASEAALWLAIKSNQVVSRIRLRLKIISALIMGLGICGMHYTGMMAAVFTPKNHSVLTKSFLDPTILSMSIAGVTFVIIGIAFFASTYKEAMNQEKLEMARKLGMAEVSANALHNVGNVLNSVNVSSSILAEKISTSKLGGLENLRVLINNNKHDLVGFFQSPQGNKVIEFLNKLPNYWQNEQSFLLKEVNSLLKNIQHIRDIIAMQQNLNKITGYEQIIVINELIEEALLIIDVDSTKFDKKIEKNLETSQPIIADKIKLLQVLVNLISNANDALKVSSNMNKILKINSFFKNKENVIIKIYDNGIGILPKNLKKIFTYGFTTKQSGHGFGLHTSLLSLHEMGGVLIAESEGLEKGATFTLELPYRRPTK